jgi:four helix bundle protein
MGIISKQLLRSAMSIGANVVEAKAASSRKDFTRFFHYALKSANESLYWLCLLRDAIEIKSSELGVLISETDELSKILGACLLTLKNKR